jgi:hypothetical protein
MPDERGSAPLFILLDAIRCWGKARRSGQNAQPLLHARMRAYRCELLSPAFESLMSLCELVLGRPIAVGRGTRLSRDENFLLDLFEGQCDEQRRYDCSPEIARAFCSALLSARVIMRLETGMASMRFG